MEEKIRLKREAYRKRIRELERDLEIATSDDECAVIRKKLRNVERNLRKYEKRPERKDYIVKIRFVFEVAGGKKTKERGFNCMQLVKFLTDEISNGGDNSWEYWHGRHLEASEGKCAYREQCPIYAKTIKNRPIQLNIF